MSIPPDMAKTGKTFVQLKAAEEVRNSPQWPVPKLVNGALQVSPSQLSLLQRCRRQWGFKYLFEREPNFEGVAAAAGKAFHAALQARYVHKTVTPEIEEQMLAEVRKGFDGVEVPMDDYRNCGRILSAVKAYNEHYQEEPFETLAVEMPVVVNIGSVDLPPHFWLKLAEHGGIAPHLHLSARYLAIDMKAIIDRLVRWPDGLVMVGDTKTSKEWKASHQTMWKRAGAPKAYAYAVQWLAQHHPELGLPRKVHGFMLDSAVIRREEATLKRPRKEGKKDHEFQRMRFYYSQEDIEEWRVNALRMVRETLLEWAEGDLGFNETNCSSYYGRVCPFLDVCDHSSWLQRRTVLAMDKFKDKGKNIFDNTDSAVLSEEDNEA